MTWDGEEAAIAMRRVGLDPDAFDLDEIAADLEARTAMNRSLIDALGDRHPLQPLAAFDPRW